MLLPNNMNSMTFFRNDDVSYDTNLEKLEKFCNIFHKFGFIQTHGIVLFGRCNNTTYDSKGNGWIFEEITPEEYHEYDKCVEVSKEFIGNNKKLVEYLNAIPDNIALHGLYHSDYSKMSYEQQENDISAGLNLLKKLFPNKIIDTFIAPFNATNIDTYKICKKYGLKISALEGEHLEEIISNDEGPIYRGQIYRYHHHRFYTESTFNYYDLSLKKIEKYFQKYSYTLNHNTGRSEPSTEMFVAFDNGEEVIKEIDIEVDIIKYVDPKKRIVKIGIDRGDIIFRLWRDGFDNLYAIEDDDSKIKIFRQLCELTGATINVLDKKEGVTSLGNSVGAVVYIALNDEMIREIFNFAARILERTAHLFILIESCKKVNAIDIAGYFHAMLIDERKIDDKTIILTFRRVKPRICLLCDRHNWAFDFSAQEIRKYLIDEYEIDIRYVVDEKDIDVNYYDAFQVFFWGEISYQKNKYTKNRIIKQVASHRWQYDAPYGPINVEEFVRTFLNDAATVICPSNILYELLHPYVKNIYLCGEGYSPSLFYFKNNRKGKISVCSAGNFRDPVKGLKDILLPACEGYDLHIAENITHEKLNEFYNMHDVYIVSSKHESNPLPLIESMACGCFPISSRIGITPELIQHKKNGYIVKERSVECFREALEWCENNLDYIRKKAKENSRNIYEKRRWEIMTEGYREMYRSHIRRR